MDPTGESLAQTHRSGPIPVDEAIRIIAQVANGLARGAYARDLVHGDIKPSNTHGCGPDGVVKVVDSCDSSKSMTAATC
jgi:serine/threonine protein kinase